MVLILIKLDLYEVKLGYDFTDDLRGLFLPWLMKTFIVEVKPEPIWKTANGNAVWDGLVSQNGVEFEANPTSFGRGVLTGNENDATKL